MRLLVLDDEPDMRDLVRFAGEDAGWRVEEGDGTTDIPESSTYDLVVLDLAMPGRDGLATLRTLGRLPQKPTIILISGADVRVLESAAALATGCGLPVAGIVGKPFLPDDITRLLPMPRTTSARHAVHPDIAGVVTQHSVSLAIATGQIKAVFQPKVRITDRSFAGAEALARWQHPVHGIIGPNLFIPVAEAHGLTGELTNHMLDLALSGCAMWHGKGLQATVAVNFPNEVCESSTLVDQTMAAVSRAGLLPSDLIGEVTETGVPHSILDTQETLGRLRLHGIGLSIDDFGTGNSSLLQLQRLPFNEIKVDREFVIAAVPENGPPDGTAVAVCKAVTAMAHSIGMTVVFEGVETEDQWNFAVACGADLVQGFLIARPMPLDELLTWTANRD